MRLVIAHGTGLTSEGMRAALGSAADFDVVAVVDDAGSLAAALARTAVDVVLLDVDLPESGGLDALELVRERAPSVAVILTGAELDAAVVDAARARGARGFVLDTIEPADLAPAIRRALAATRP